MSSTVMLASVQRFQGLVTTGPVQRIPVKSIGAIDGDRHLVADFRRFIKQLKDLRRSRRRNGQTGGLTPDLEVQFRNWLVERLRDHDCARAMFAEMLTLPQEGA